MKQILLRTCLAAGLASLALSCSLQESDILDAFSPGDRFYARIESSDGPDTKVYADDKLRVLWDAEDHISIFNKYTYNQEYRFAGKTGDNSGAFKIVPNDDFVTGNELDLVYAVYPYQESTSIDNDGVLTVTLPATQAYRENSFGRGANTMVSCTANNQLLFKNIGGYLSLKLYGENVSVSSISIKGNKGEPLAGEAVVVSTTNAVPTLTMSPQATTEITLRMDEPVKLGTTAEDATVFWLVIPPVTFEEGFTLTVANSAGDTFVKSTTKPFSLSRNTLSRMSALKVDLKDTADPVESTLAEIADCADGTLVKTGPVKVMAESTLGVIIADETGLSFLFSRTPLNAFVGDMIRLVAHKSTYRSLPELQEIQSLEVLSTGNAVSYPAPEDISSRADFGDPFFTQFRYVSFEGNLRSWQTGNYGVSYFIQHTEDPSLPDFYLFYPSDYQNPEGYYQGDHVQATGYFAGFNGDINNLCIIITSMTVTHKDMDESLIPHNQIWYTTDNGNIFNKSDDCHFYNNDGEELSFTQTWDGTKWIMTFSDDISYWEGDWFYVTSSDSRLVSLGVPSSLDPERMTKAGFYQKSFSGDYVSTIERFYGQYEGIADQGHLFLTGKDLYMLSGIASAYEGTLSIPEGTTEIGGYAFVGSKAKIIILPSTIKLIDDFAFENCYDITDLYCYAEICPQFNHSSSIWTYVQGTSGVLHYPAESDYAQFPVPWGWSKVADLPNWDGFRLKATSDNTVLVLTHNSLDKYPGRDLFYSFNTLDWVKWEYNTEVTLNLNQNLYLKGNVIFGDTCRIEAKSGTAYGSGYICSLFDNGTDYASTTIPAQALQDVFVKDGGITGELRFPDVVKEIGTKRLYNYTCHGPWWTSVILPSELELIGGTCFEGNRMTEITIPKTVKYIGDAAYNGCHLLSTVYFTGTVAEWEAIEKGDYRWEDGPPATTVTCTDGEAAF